MKKITKKNKIAAGIVLGSMIFGLTGLTAAFAAGPEGVNLGSAGNFVILSKTGISTTGTTAITGTIGLSPAAASYLTGFALTLPAAGAFSTSALVTGNVYAPGYADPTPA
ncbi:MAG: ice-binding family protein, partial [Candidatus Pacebacteria bacterium]|nr:ice-binding family protein [Candidatus Paceibacterota bacterium]